MGMVLVWNRSVYKNTLNQDHDQLDCRHLLAAFNATDHAHSQTYLKWLTHYFTYLVLFGLQMVHSSALNLLKSSLFAATFSSSSAFCSFVRIALSNVLSRVSFGLPRRRQNFEANRRHDSLREGNIQTWFIIKFINSPFCYFNGPTRLKLTKKKEPCAIYSHENWARSTLFRIEFFCQLCVYITSAYLNQRHFKSQ